jgi:hypothetical protein
MLFATNGDASLKAHQKKGDRIMKNRKPASLPGSFVLFGTLLLGGFLVGCGEDTGLQPSPSDSPEFARVIHPPGVQPLCYGGGNNEETFVVDPDEGGSFRVGRFEVTIPPEALHESINLTIHDRTNESGEVIVELSPHGYRFDAPVTLTTDLTGTTAQEWPRATVYWFNERAGRWVDTGGTWNRHRRILSVDLNHFSIYGDGRGGW